MNAVVKKQRTNKNAGKALTKRTILSKEAFVDAIASGKHPADAYWEAGGTIQEVKEATRQGRLKINQWRSDIDAALVSKQPQHLATMLNLLPLAAEVYSEVLQDRKASTRDKLAAAKAVQDYSALLMPKRSEHIETKQLEVGDNLDDLIKELLSQPRAIEGFIEGEIVEESGASETDQSYAGEGEE